MFYSDFDNFDQYINYVKGAGSIHTVNGIMLQEFKSTNNPPILEDISPVDRTKENSVHLSINSDLPECFVTKRKSTVKKMAKINCIKIKLPSHCQILRILFTSSYVVHVNLNR